MKKILIIGASILQLPAIKKAKEMGLYVGVVDYNPKAVGISYADEYFNVSTIDEEGIYEVAKQFKADGIMTLATDMPMRSLAYATNKLGLNGISYDTAIKATDKGEMIKAFEKAEVEHPWYFILESPKELKEVMNKITYPCISKPVDNSGSRGVVHIKNKYELEAALEYSSISGRNGSIIIEEFLEGNEVSVEIMTLDGEVNVLQVTDKLTTGKPYFVEMGHSQPCSLENKDIEDIKELAAKAVKAVGIYNGPAHVEIMLTPKGPKVIELGARMGGDCITTHLVPLSTGVDMIKATIENSLGERPCIEPKYRKGAAIRFISGKCGTIKNITGVKEAEKITGVQEVSFMKNVGEKIGEIHSSSDRVGYVITQSDDAETAIKYCNQAINKINIEV